MSKLHSISDLAGNKDYQAFAVWIGNILRDPSSVREETAKRYSRRYGLKPILKVNLLDALSAAFSHVQSRATLRLAVLAMYP